MTANQIIDSLCLDENLKQRLVEFMTENKSDIDRLCTKCKNSFKCLSAKSDLMRLGVCVSYAAKYTYPQYERLGIGENVFFDTMGDIALWCYNNKNKGLKNYNWIKNHLNCELFRIGRLQFQLYVCNNRTFEYDCLPFDYGARLVYIHIPQGEKLIYSDCVKSILDAKAFFEKYFPDYEYEFFFCESWLLFDENYLFMEPSCNILQFQALFTIVFSNNDDAQAIERIFGKKRLIKSLYPENTSLQKSAKKYMLGGNKMGIGIGLIAKDEI